jgi:hypothetical protein
MGGVFEGWVCGSYSLAERPALANSDDVAVGDTESRRDVCGEVLVALLVTGVLGDEVEVLAADDECAVHLGGDDGAGEDTATDGDEAGEWALLVCGRRISVSMFCTSSWHALIAQCVYLQYGLLLRMPLDTHTDVAALNGGLWGPEAQTDVLVPSPATLSDLWCLAALHLLVGEDVWLLLESALALDGQFGRHDCGSCAIGLSKSAIGVSVVGRWWSAALLLKSSLPKFEVSTSACRKIILAAVCAPEAGTSAGRRRKCWDDSLNFKTEKDVTMP